MTEPSADITLTAFNRAMGDRYRIIHRLGEGGSGTTYRAHDTRRGIDVCVKLYHIPQSDLLQRDWYITSTLKSNFLADTFTVETFADESGEARTACISRFIPGQNLQTFLHSSTNLTRTCKPTCAHS